MKKSLALALILASTCLGVVTHAQTPAVEGRWHATFRVDRNGVNDAPTELVISVDQERVSGMLGDVQIRGTFREGKLTFTTPKGQFYDSYEGAMQIDGSLAGDASRASYSASDRGYWLKVMGTWSAIRKGTTLEDADSAEDRKVLTAVIDHTIRAYVQRHGGPSAVLYIIGQTAPICETDRDPRSKPYCMSRSALGINPSDFGLLVTEVVPSAHRAELLASIKERNAVRHLLPVSEGRDVKVVAAPFMMETPAGPAAATYIVVGLPGYSSAGHALVNAFIDCGEKCGFQLEWLVEKRGADWQVRIRDGRVHFGGGVEPEMRATKFEALPSKPPPLVPTLR